MEKKDILKAVKEINDEIDLTKLSVKQLKAECLSCSSWHNTSKIYNKTDFYEINTDIKNWSQADVQCIIDNKNKELNN